LLNFLFMAFINDYSGSFFLCAGKLGPGIFLFETKLGYKAGEKTTCGIFHYFCVLPLFHLSNQPIRKFIMSTKIYNILVKGEKGVISAKYRSPQKLEIGEDLLLFYDGKTNLVRIVEIRRGVLHAIEIEAT
jgi:hypothetical protein